MEEPGRLQSMGVAKSQTLLRDFTFFSFHLKSVIQILLGDIRGSILDIKYIFLYILKDREEDAF